MKTPKPHKLPSGNWRIQLRLNGVSIPVISSTKTECIHQAQLIKAEYKYNKKLKAKTDKTIKELITEYIDSRSAVLSPATIAGYNTIKNNRFKGYINKKPHDINNWQAVINDEVKAGIKPKTIKSSWSLVAASLKHSGLDVPTVKLPQIVQADRPWLDSEQIRVFINAVKGEDCEIAALLALHSLRRSEILYLTWDKIDLDNEVIHIQGSAVPGEKNRLVMKETNKTKKSRRDVPIMIPALKTALLSIPEEQRTGRIYTHYQNSLWREINRICREHNLPEVGVHGLRHSFASLAHHVGMPEQEAMLIGGWENSQTMHKIYEHISSKDRIKAENKLKQFFKNAHKNAHEV